MENFNYTEKKDTRSGFGDGLTELGLKNKNRNIVNLKAVGFFSIRMNIIIFLNLKLTQEKSVPKNKKSVQKRTLFLKRV